MQRVLIPTLLTLALYLTALGCSSTPADDIAAGQAELASMLAVAKAAPADTDWLIRPLDAANRFSQAFNVIATNDSSRVRLLGDGESFEVFFQDTDGSQWQALIVNRQTYEFRENFTHVLRWDRPSANADGTPLVDFDGLYRITINADYEVWDASPDSAEMVLDLPRADRVTATARAIDANGNVSEPSNTLVVRQGAQ